MESLLLDTIAIKVNFNNSTYPVDEREGSVRVSLVLDKPSSCCFHVFVEFIDVTALGELWAVHNHVFNYHCAFFKSTNSKTMVQVSYNLITCNLYMQKPDVCYA